jgi:hypothetical protein
MGTFLLFLMKIAEWACLEIPSSDDGYASCSFRNFSVVTVLTVVLGWFRFSPFLAYWHVNRMGAFGSKMPGDFP